MNQNDKSLAFYKEALDLTEVRRKDAEDGSFTLVYLGDGTTPHLLELTWLRDMDRPYNLGDNEIHLAFEVDDFDAAHKKHKEMGCICYENPGMGIYFISDPEHVAISLKLRLRAARALSLLPFSSRRKSSK